jgi:hypothetical protein
MVKNPATFRSAGRQDACIPEPFPEVYLPPRETASPHSYRGLEKFGFRANFVKERAEIFMVRQILWFFAEFS